MGPQVWGHFSGASGSLSSLRGPKGGVPQSEQLSPHLSEDKWTVCMLRNSRGPGDQSLTVHQADGREAVSLMHTSRGPGPIAGTICFSSSSPVQRGKLRLRVAQAHLQQSWGPSPGLLAGLKTLACRSSGLRQTMSLPQPPSNCPAVSAGRRQVPGPEEDPGAWGPWSETLSLCNLSSC